MREDLDFEFIIMDQEQYQIEVKDYLESISYLAICELSLFQNYNFHPVVKLIDTEVFYGDLSEGLPIRIFLMDEHNCEVFHEDRNYFPHSSVGLLEYVKLPKWNVSTKLENSMELETEIIVEWFIDCWQKSGGQSFELPAYICQHDDVMSFNLKTLEWKNEKDDKWNYFTN